MPAGIETKYIILFAILIALTGFTFESQLDNSSSQQKSLDNAQHISVASRP